MIKVFLTDFSLPYTFRLIRQHDGNMMMMVMIKEELFWGCMRWQTRVWRKKSSFNYKFPLDVERKILGFDSTAQFRTNYSLVFVPNNPWGFFTHPKWMLMAHKEKIEHNTHSNISIELKLNWKLLSNLKLNIFTKKIIFLPTSSAVVVVCCYSRVYASSASFTSEDTWYSREKKYLSPINKKTTFFLLPSIFNYWSKWDKFGRKAAQEPAKSSRTPKNGFILCFFLLNCFAFTIFFNFRMSFT